MTVQIGDIFWHTVTYRNSAMKTREGLAAYATITGSSIKDFEGKFNH